MIDKIKAIRNFPLYKIDAIFVATICSETLSVANIGATIASFRRMFPDVMIQGITPNVIFGRRHMFEVLKIILESKKRKINIVKRLEMEFLMRLVCSNQVDKAINIGGLKNYGPGCFVLLSEKRGAIIESLKYLLKYLRINLATQNDSLLSASKEKMIYICETLELPYSNFNRTEFLKILTEKAALISLK